MKQNDLRYWCCTPKRASGEDPKTNSLQTRDVKVASIPKEATHFLIKAYGTDSDEVSLMHTACGQRSTQVNKCAKPLVRERAPNTST